MRLEFWGAARTVTGSRHLVKTDSGVNILLDCGLFQGQGKDTYSLNSNFGFDPSEVDVLILSHAHIDHSGAIPRLVRDGFQGRIYATPPSVDLCDIMLYDSAYIQQADLKYVNRRRRKRKEPLLEPLYSPVHVGMALDLIQKVDYDEETFITTDISFKFTDAAHIIGSAAVHLKIKEGGKVKRLTFTGDIGRAGDKILRPPQEFPQADYIISESTYGNKLHETYQDLEAHLYNIVKKTCMEQQGKLIIPAFSLDRTQEVIYALDRMEHENLIPRLKVFVDSPLSVKATDIMRDYEEYFNEELVAYLKVDREGDAFGFRNLKYITDVQESKKINNLKQPCIIISASGMAEAGRIKHHIANNIDNSNNTILMVGYCTPNSLGGKLKARVEEVRIFGENHKVKAGIEVIDAYSAHGDYKEMIDYLSCQDSEQVKKTFLVHGEYETQSKFAERLNNVGFKNVEIPKKGQGFDL